MANYYLGLARGQYDAEGSAIVVGTSSNGSSSDVEVRVQTTNNITAMETCELLECIKNYILNYGLESKPGVDLPQATPSG